MAAATDQARRNRTRQRGAAAVFAAIALVAGLSATFLAIDLGRLYYVQRDLQRMANLAALDAARMAGGCMGVPDNVAETAHAEAVRSVVVNQGEAGFVPAGGVQVGQRRVGTDGRRYFEPLEDPDEKNRAVQVSLQRSAPSRLLPFARSSARTLAATAAAYSRPQATVEVGSQLADLNPDLLNQLLGGLLGGPVAVGVGGYQGLFDASVPITQVLEEITVGTPEELFATPVPVPDLLNALADVLADQGNAAAAAAAAAIASAATVGTSVTPAELVGVEEPAAGALVGAGALILSAAQQANASVADGTNLVDFPVDLPSPFEDGGVEVRIIEASQQTQLSAGEPSGGGDDFARNAQALVQASLPFNVLTVGRVDLPLWVQGAQATAYVRDIRCARRGVPGDTVFLNARTAIARVGIGRFDDIELPNPTPRPADILALDVAGTRVRVVGWAMVEVGRHEDLPLRYDGPFPETQTVGTPPGEALAGAALDLASRVELELVLPAGLPPLQTQAVLALARPILENTIRPALVQALESGGQDVLESLTEEIGLRLGGADITVHSVLADEPVLFTR